MDWIKTDDLQFIKKVSENEFEVIETFKAGRNYIPYYTEININDYYTDDLEREVSGYYDSLDKVKQLYGDDMWKQIVAEIIAENHAVYEGVSFSSKSELKKYLAEEYGIMERVRLRGKSSGQKEDQS